MKRRYAYSLFRQCEDTFMLLPHNQSNGFVCRVPQSERDWRTFFQIRYDAYVQEFRYLPPEGLQFEDERDWYDEEGRSVPLILTQTSSDDENVIACLRLILGNMVPQLPYAQHLEIFNPPDKEDTIEISRLVISPNYRGIHTSEILRTLLVQAHNCCTSLGMKHLVAAVDPIFYRLARRIGLPINMIGSIGEYWGRVVPVNFPRPDSYTPEVLSRLYPHLKEKSE